MSKYISLFRTFSVIFFLILSFFLLGIRNVYATPEDPSSFVVTKDYYDSNRPIPPEIQNAPNCPVGCNVTGVCVNSQNDNNCDEPRCGGGNAWTKYNLSSCKEIKYKEDTDTLTCQAVYTENEKVYSIGDKCTGNYPYLDSGSCSSPYAISRYKACCSGGSLSTNSCVPFDSDGAGDSEGRCPAGSYEVFCGFGGYPACSSSSVCGSPPASSGPAPAPTPPPVTCVESAHDPNPFPQCGVSCSDPNTFGDHLLSVTEQTCTDGSYRYSCSDSGRITGQCGNPNRPTLNTFVGSSNQCYSSPYTASLSWTGDPLSADDSCGSGFWVDISTDSNFGSYYHKCVRGNSTIAPDDFGLVPGGSTLTFQKGQTYYGRVFNNSHSSTISLFVPNNICS